MNRCQSCTHHGVPFCEAGEDNAAAGGQDWLVNMNVDVLGQCSFQLGSVLLDWPSSPLRGPRFNELRKKEEFVLGQLFINHFSMLLVSLEGLGIWFCRD